LILEQEDGGRGRGDGIRKEMHSVAHLCPQTFGNRILGVMAWLMPLSVTVSTFGSANGTLFAAGR